MFFKETVGPDQKWDKIVQFFGCQHPSFLAAAIWQQKLADNERQCIAEMTGAVYLEDALAAQNIWTEINTPA